MQLQATVLIVVICLCFVVLLQIQLCRLRRQSNDASFTLPLARTFADLLSTCSAEERMNLIARLEDTRFRSVSVMVFSNLGEVYADSSSPVSGKLPMPASSRQKDVFEMLKEKKAFEEPNGVHGTLFRSCNPRGGEKSTSTIAGMSIKEMSALVAVCSCGEEDV